LYDWFIKEAEVFPSRQIEFARLNLTHTVMSKRWLLRLVEEKHVSGWDDPRMPTIAGLRRRGYTPEAIRSFVSQIGIAKNDSMVDIAFLEYCLREDLNKRSLRAMAVLKPLKLIIENWPAGKVEELDAVNNPEDESAGTRKIPFSGELWIERDDFEEIPPPKYFRLYPGNGERCGNSVRLRYGYIVTCTGFDKDSAGNISAVRCTYDPETRGGNAGASSAFDKRKVKGTIHWVSAAHAVPIEVRIYDYLFSAERPMETAPRPDGTPGSFIDNLNPFSLEIIPHAWGEPALAKAGSGGLLDRRGLLDRWQFERLGYFVRDPDASGGKPVFNKTIGLRDTWARIKEK
ncbi:MAG: glutamine--tRNA ligase, partial [Treponema sp.]|nr:glutamine--tRNA ligase [Treponema sp.]